MSLPNRYPKATWLGNGVSGGSYHSADGELGPWRIVLHTTETASMPSYRSGNTAPHLTYDPGTRIWYQHTSLQTAARALRNPAGGVQTNRERALQVEIICYSAKGIADQRDDRQDCACARETSKLKHWSPRAPYSRSLLGTRPTGSLWSFWPRATLVARGQSVSTERDYSSRYHCMPRYGYER